MARPLQIAVCGTSHDRDGYDEVAVEVGRRLAEAGVVVVCGGLTGVMAAAARGAREAGGEVIGIVPGNDVADANQHCTHVVATGIGHARNVAVVSSGAVVIAIGGQWGTLSEIGLARAIGRPVVALYSWQLRGRGRMESAPGVVHAEDPRHAVALALELALTEE